MNSDLWAEIRRLFEVEKLSKSAIARRLNIHRWTVRRALGSTQGTPVDKPRGAPKPSKVELFKPYLQERLKMYPDLSQRKLFLEIRNQGYGGGPSIVRDYLITIRSPKSNEAFLRLETLPGEFAQVDWANVGTITIGNAKRKLSCFVMVLSYSRMIYLEFMLSQRWENFVQAHINAFDYFGGVAHTINYDNLKTVVLTRVGREIRFHARFMDFAGCYLFKPVPCGIRRPNEKGKVESGIKYVRTAFLAGREIRLFTDLQRDALAWRDQEANIRVHGTTHEKPIDRFEAEKMQLYPLPARGFDCSILETVQATRQALIHFETNRYSVAHACAGKKRACKIFSVNSVS